MSAKPRPARASTTEWLSVSAEPVSDSKPAAAQRRACTNAIDVTIAHSTDRLWRGGPADAGGSADGTSTRSMVER